MDQLSDAVLAKMTGVKLLCSDVDGVMTDGGLYYGNDGDTMRRYNVKDGMGLKKLMSAGISVAVITTGTVGAIVSRCKTLGIENAFFGVDDKLACLRELCDSLHISMDDVVYIGDDVNDLDVLGAVGLSVAVSDSVPAVLRMVDHVTQRAGGQGAVREVCDLILDLKNDAA